jgi:transposase
MASPLSLDLRERIFRAYVAKEGGYGTLAKRFAVDLKSVRRIVAKATATGSVAPLPHGGGFPPTITDEELPELLELVASSPDSTAQELADEWSRRKGRVIHRSSMVRALSRAGLSTKKRRIVRSNKIAPT